MLKEDVRVANRDLVAAQSAAATSGDANYDATGGDQTSSGATDEDDPVGIVVFVLVALFLCCCCCGIATYVQYC